MAELNGIAQQKAEDRLMGLDAQLRRWGDDLLLHYYDRRAPSMASDDPGAKREQPIHSGEVSPVPSMGPTFPSAENHIFVQEDTAR